MTRVIICPGIHDPALTQCFVERLRSECLRLGPPSNSSNFSYLDDLLIFPDDYPSPPHILQFLRDRLNPAESIVFISFSAGVVGAIGAAWGWQMLGGEVKTFVAIDGWGVPLFGNFPIYRLSHDYFTHWTSSLLGGGQESFYADPPVEHLELWRSPQLVLGWHSQLDQESQLRLTAARFLTMLLERTNC